LLIAEMPSPGDLDPLSTQIEELDRRGDNRQA
jgi:hypothetical protein